MQHRQSASKLRRGSHGPFTPHASETSASTASLCIGSGLRLGLKADSLIAVELVSEDLAAATLGARTMPTNA